MNWRNTILLGVCIILLVIILYIYTNSSYLLFPKEGFETNSKYTYIPDKSNPTISIPIYVNYVIDETVNMLSFFKNKKGLIYIPPPKIPDTPPPEEKYVDDSDEVLGTPSTSATAPETFTGGKKEAFTGEIEFSKEYQADVAAMDLTTKYLKFRDNLEKELDSLLSPVFQLSNLEKDLNGLITKLKTTLEFFNREYSYVNYYVIQSDHSGDYKPNVFIDEIVKLVKQSKSSQSELDDLKKMVYSIIGRSYLYTKMVEHYKQNVKMYTKNDDALFIINSGIQHLKTMDYSELKRDGQYIQFGNTTTQIHYDGIRLTEVSCIVSELFKLVVDNKITQFKYDYKQFVDDYKHDTNTPKNSVYLFMLNHPPQFPGQQMNK